MARNDYARRPGGGQGLRDQRPRNCRFCNAVVQGHDDVCDPCRQGAQRGREHLNGPSYPTLLNAEGKLCADSLDAWANDLALAFAQGSPALTKSQLRGFYGHVKRLESSLGRNRPFEDVVCELTRLKPLVHARFERKKIPREFKTFIERNVAASVASKEEFGAFVRHFEAVAAFCEGRIKDEGKGRD